ncbi:helix-turn-helix domain-containing protein [Corynebacterium striatum]|uniref:helix-turn-helix domain-containing protein n=1 Tax=Corynebacterium striatum TaxID=43770 RepID=UPI003ACFC94E|nr:helix-turn-helix domain-containing protein [Corynebacterium striatum]HCG2985186.1 helix-turn-helix domain-containing protein [Corynebacterium striatum]HCG3001008.1 helix-turn-helix domain-containing protein [Corynebacterium striatum]HCG3016899.1 helix-turn-helix domain-containing protein [Corynebacterium striatum]HCG3143530.1 helix-turn-helix domain-containing protein [Corynebacterium striatum]
MTTPQQWPAGQLLQHAREREGLSKAEAARRANLSESWWRRLETGVNIRNGKKIPITPTPEAVARAAQAVNLPVNQLLDAAGFAPQREAPEEIQAEAQQLLAALPVSLQREAVAYIRGLTVGSRQS